MPSGAIRARQRLRRFPGARTVQERVPQLLRRSRVFRELVRRVYAVEAPSRTPVDVAPGKIVEGIGTENLPVVLVVILGAGEQMINQTVDEVARLQLMTAGFRPVFVTDTPVFATMRRYGYPAELLVPANQWRGGEWTWEEYSRRVVGSMFDSYQATASVTLGETGLHAAARVVLGSLR